eukprot:tig00020944_g16346.t1
MMFPPSTPGTPWSNVNTNMDANNGMYATVYWGSSDPQGSAITKYTLTTSINNNGYTSCAFNRFTSGAEDLWGTPTSLGRYICPGWTYSFSVTATNGIGTSGASGTHTYTAPIYDRRLWTANALAVSAISTTSVNVGVSWSLIYGRPGTPAYASNAVATTCTSISSPSVTLTSTRSLAAESTSVAAGPLSGFPELATAYTISCTSTITQADGYSLTASGSQSSSPAKTVTSSLSFTVSAVSATSVTTSAISWTLSASGAASSPTLKTLLVSCTNNGLTQSTTRTLSVSGTTSEAAVTVSGLADTASYHTYCTATLSYSYASTATGTANIIVPDKTVLNNALSMIVSPSSISSILVSGLAWTLTPGLFSTPSYPSLTVACTWNGETRSATLTGIAPVSRSAQSFNVSGFRPSTTSYRVNCSATLLYSSGGPARASNATNSTAAQYCVQAAMTTLCPGVSGLPMNSTLLPVSSSWSNASSFECLLPYYNTTSVFCATSDDAPQYLWESTAKPLVPNSQLTSTSWVVPAYRTASLYRCIARLVFQGVGFQDAMTRLIEQASPTTCTVPAAPARWVQGDALQFTVAATSTTSVATSAVAWALPSEGAIDTPIYGNLTLTCTGNGVTRSATYGPVTPGSFSAPAFTIAGFPEEPFAYSIACTASLPYEPASTATATKTVSSLAARSVTSPLSFEIRVSNASAGAITTSEVSWSLSAGGAADSPAYSGLRLSCTSDGQTETSVVLDENLPRPGSASATNVTVSGLPDMSFFNVIVNCTAMLHYSNSGVASGTARIVDLVDSRAIGLWTLTATAQEAYDAGGLRHRIALSAPAVLVNAEGSVLSVAVDVGSGEARSSPLELSGSCLFNDKGWIFRGFGRAAFFVAHTGDGFEASDGSRIPAGSRYYEWGGDNSTCYDVNVGTAEQISSRARRSPVSVVFGGKVLDACGRAYQIGLK